MTEARKAACELVWSRVAASKLVRSEIEESVDGKVGTGTWRQRWIAASWFIMSRSKDAVSGVLSGEAGMASASAGGSREEFMVLTGRSTDIGRMLGGRSLSLWLCVVHGRLRGGLAAVCEWHRHEGEKVEGDVLDI